MSWRTAPEAIPEEKIGAEYEADVVVLGLGYAGTAAVRAAAEGGLSVIGIESQPAERFNSFGRDVGHINSEFLKSRGVPEVDPIDLFNEWMRRAGNRANPRLVMKYCRNCGAAFDWFTNMYTPEELKDLHVAFWPEGRAAHKAATEAGDPSLNGFNFWVGTAEFPDPMGWPGGPTLQQCLKDNQKKAEEAGAKLFFGWSGEQPVMDGARVAGIIAGTKKGEYMRVKARKGVVLAAGDFGGNKEMVEDLCCDIADLMRPGDKIPPSFGRRGRGQQLGVWAGGRLETRPLPTMGGNTAAPMSLCTCGAVWLDRDGKRYCNEIFGGTEVGGFAANQDPRGETYVVFDEHWPENEMQWAVPTHGGFDFNTAGESAMALFAAAKEQGDSGRVSAISPPPMRKPIDIYCGNTPEELVANAGITGEKAQNIIDSIKRYNEMCAAGRDDDFGRDARVLNPLTGRLFLQKIDPTVLGLMLVTVGGLVTDENQQVLNEDYERIEGLYATGNCCGRRFGIQYATPIAGVSIGMAMTMGRQLGMELAE